MQSNQPLFRVMLSIACLTVVASLAGAESFREMASELRALQAADDSSSDMWVTAIRAVGQEAESARDTEIAAGLLASVLQGRGLPTHRTLADYREELVDIEHQIEGLVQASRRTTGSRGIGVAYTQLTERQAVIRGRMWLPSEARDAAVYALGGLRSEGADDVLAELIAGRSVDVANGAMLAAVTGGRAELADAVRAKFEASDRDPTIQATAVHVLGQLAPGEHVELFVTALASEAVIVRLQAVRALEQAGSAEVVEALIERIAEDADLRIREEASLALAALSGRAPSLDAEAWTAWWNAGEGELRSSRIDRFSGERNGLAAREQLEGDAVLPTFFGQPLRSGRVLFVIDRSLSMVQALDRSAPQTGPTGAPIPAPRGQTSRWAAVRAQIAVALTSLVELEDAQFGFVFFDGTVEATSGGRMARARGNVGRLMRAMPTTTPGETTARNPADALRVAFEVACGVSVSGAAIGEGMDDLAADTIVLITSGGAAQTEKFGGARPSSARYHQALAEALASWNIVRGVQLHHVALGDPVPAFDAVARRSGGWAHTVTGTD